MNYDVRLNIKKSILLDESPELFECLSDMGISYSEKDGSIVMEPQQFKIGNLNMFTFLKNVNLLSNTKVLVPVIEGIGVYNLVQC